MQGKWPDCHFLGLLISSSTNPKRLAAFILSDGGALKAPHRATAFCTDLLLWI